MYPASNPRDIISVPMINRRSLFQLISAAGLIFSPKAVCAASDDVVLSNFHLYTKGAYAAWAGMWSLNIDPTMGLGHKAVEGQDFISSIVVRPDSFPRQSAMKWRVPDALAAKSGVYGYLHLAYGNYDHTPVERPIAPVRISGLKQFTVNFDFQYVSGPSSGSVLLEFWLTSAPGNLDSKVFETGLFAHSTPETIRYFKKTKLIGKYTDALQREWLVHINNKMSPAFVMFLPTDEGNVVGAINWKDFLHYLVEKNILTGNEWLNGLALGVEPAKGAGEIVLKEFDVILN